MRPWMFAALALSSAPSAAGSIKDPICTDRPGHSSSTCAAPKGHVQIETGLVSWSRSRDSGVRSTELVLGATAIKYGVTDTMHVEVALTPYTRVAARAGGVRVARDSGFGDVVVKVKQELKTRSGSLSAALYPYVKLPTASKRLGNGKTEAGLIVPLSLALGGTPLSLSTSPEVDLIADGDGHGYHAGMAHTLALGLAASDKLSIAGELWGAWDYDLSTTRQATIGGNAAYRLTNDLQIDGQVDFGLTRATSDFGVSAGISARF